MIFVSLFSSIHSAVLYFYFYIFLIFIFYMFVCLLYIPFECTYSYFFMEFYFLKFHYKNDNKCLHICTWGSTTWDIWFQRNGFRLTSHYHSMKYLIIGFWFYVYTYVQISLFLYVFISFLCTLFLCLKNKKKSKKMK